MRPQAHVALGLVRLCQSYSNNPSITGLVQAIAALCGDTPGQLASRHRQTDPNGQQPDPDEPRRLPKIIRRMTPEQIDRAADLRASGLTLATIGRQLGFSASTISVAVRKHGKLA